MGFTYTATDLKTWLKADLSNGGAWPFVVERLENSGHRFDLMPTTRGSKPFMGNAKTVFVGNSARDRDEATRWSKDALREWAMAGVDAAGNYFPLIARDFALNGPGKGHTAKSLGTMLDFLTLFSQHGSFQASSDMLKPIALLGKDVPEIFCFIYNDIYSPTSQLWVKLGLKGNDNHKAPVNAVEGERGPKGLNEQFWDSGYPTSDQTHHFAAYFCHGASHGFDPWGILVALKASNDLSYDGKTILNQGDYDLGWVGAKWGASYKNEPRFIGDDVTNALEKGDKDVTAKVQD